MPAGRFYVGDLALAPGMELELPPDVAHRARDVLRLAPGQTLSLLDGKGGVYSAQLLTVSRHHLTVQLGEHSAEEEGPVRVVLCQGMLKAARYEIALEKCTELGAAEFVPLLSLRAVAATEEAGASKQKRWARIVAEAMEQCGGTYLPKVDRAADTPASAGCPPHGRYRAHSLGGRASRFTLRRPASLADRPRSPGSP